MATIYASTTGSGAVSRATAMSRSTPATLDRALTVHLSGDRIEVEPGTYTTPIYNRLLVGGGPTQKTTVAAVDLGGNGKPLLQVADGSSPLFWPTADYLCLENLELKHGDRATKSSTGEHLISTGSGIHARFVDLLGVKAANTRNCCIYSNYGPTPHDLAGHAGTPGLDDASWRVLGCELGEANNSIVVCHGTGWEFGPWLNGLGTLVRGSMYHWGDSTAVTAGKHGIYLHSRQAVIHGYDFHNESADVPWQGSAISQRVSGLEVFDTNAYDCNAWAVFWYDDQNGVTRIHDNRWWNIYHWLVYMDAQNDDGPVYAWGPNDGVHSTFKATIANPVDRFVIAKNTVHVRGTMSGTPPALAQAHAMIDMSSANAPYLGGMEIADNVLMGNWLYGIDQKAYLANNGVTGTLHEHHNRWYKDGNAAIQFKYGNTAYQNLIAWQAA